MLETAFTREDGGISKCPRSVLPPQYQLIGGAFIQMGPSNLHACARPLPRTSSFLGRAGVGQIPEFKLFESEPRAAPMLEISPINRRLSLVCRQNREALRCHMFSFAEVNSHPTTPIRSPEREQYPIPIGADSRVIPAPRLASLFRIR